jgi:hypothetical protein
VKAPPDSEKNVAPTPRATIGRWADEPSSSGWEAAEALASEPAVVTATPQATVAADGAATVEAQPPASPALIAALGPMRAPYQTSPGVGLPLVPLPSPLAAPQPLPDPTTSARGSAATSSGLGTAMREEVWAIVRAAVEEAMGPLVARQRELEARVERAERENEAERTSRARHSTAPPAAGGGASVGPSTAASRLASIGPVAPASIPVALGPSLAPPGFSAAAPPALPRFEAPAPAGARGLPERKTPSAHPVGPRPSIGPTGYGVGVVNASASAQGRVSSTSFDIEGFDGGRRKRRLAGFVVAFMLLIIVGVVTMTVLSHN